MISAYLDREGRLAQWPKRRRLAPVLAWLAEKLEVDQAYSEKEVNARLNEWHTFRDPALLRRELVDAGLLARKSDGSSYWRVR